MNLDDHHSIRTWVDGCCRNDRRCQEQLYRHYFDAMLRMVRRYTQDEDQMISIINDGFLKAFKNMDKYDFSGSLEGWLRTIVFRGLSDYFRKKKNVFQVVSLMDRDQISQNDGPLELYYEDLVALLVNLPEMTRKVFELYAIQGYLHREISSMLNISEGTSKWHVSEARSLLKGLLKKKVSNNYV